MITFTPTSVQQMLVDAVRRYADNDIRIIAHEVDENSELPAEVITKGWELGLLPGMIPETYGGYADGASAISGALVLEELAYGDLSIAMNLWAPSTFALAVLISGTEEQKRAYLPSFCDAAQPIKTAALIEPSITFDPWRLATTASQHANGVLLEGEKTYVPLAADAEQLIIYARDSETGRVEGYFVNKGAPGLEISERNQLMGVRAMPLYRIKLSGVKVDAGARLGGDEGTKYREIVNRGRVALGAMAVGVARASFEYARDYAKQRVQFGTPIASKQAIAFRIAEVAIEIDAARLLVWEAAWSVEQGFDITQAATVLKQYVSKMALFATDSGVQILGGHGYIRENPVERWLRDARGFATFDGLALV